MFITFFFSPKKKPKKKHTVQELGGGIQGESTDFQAVPGHGLQCVVSGVEQYAVREGEISESLTKHLYSSTEVSLVPGNCKELLGTAYAPKKYQVIIVRVYHIQMH